MLLALKCHRHRLLLVACCSLLIAYFLPMLLLLLLDTLCFRKFLYGFCSCQTWPLSKFAFSIFVFLLFFFLFKVFQRQLKQSPEKRSLRRPTAVTTMKTARSLAFGKGRNSFISQHGSTSYPLRKKTKVRKPKKRTRTTK